MVDRFRHRGVRRPRGQGRRLPVSRGTAALKVGPPAAAAQAATTTTTTEETFCRALFRERRAGTASPRDCMSAGGREHPPRRIGEEDQPETTLPFQRSASPHSSSVSLDARNTNREARRKKEANALPEIRRSQQAPREERSSADALPSVPLWGSMAQERPAFKASTPRERETQRLRPSGAAPGAAGQLAAVRPDTIVSRVRTFSIIFRRKNLAFYFRGTGYFNFFSTTIRSKTRTPSYQKRIAPGCQLFLSSLLLSFLLQPRVVT